MINKEIEIFYPETQQDWRNWLLKNHVEKDAVWLVMYKQSANMATVKWSDAVDEALCFGWIDSLKKKLDDERSIQFFSKRKPKSTWSKINKQKIEKLIQSELMAGAGFKSIETAKQNGSWTILDEVEELIIPMDLEVALKINSEVLDLFLSLSKSVKKEMLQRLVFAKREETRQKRIRDIVEFVENKLKKKNL